MNEPKVRAVTVKNRPSQLIKLMRPHQWMKNVFVLTGLIFGHAWSSPLMLLKVGTAAVAFCLLSSAIYILNDLMDRENDRRHPKKRFRPLAAGTVTPMVAMNLSLLLAGVALTLGFLVGPWAGTILLGYGLLNTAYSIRLKHVVILDVFCIALGFMFRILVGTLGVGIPPSQWLLLCGLMVTLFLGFAKRRAEILALSGEKTKHRQVLAKYHPVVLDEMMGVCATGVIISYSLYTMSAETITMHQTDSLIYTVPFVMYGLFRYLFVLHNDQKGGDPSKDLFRDRHILASVIGWGTMTLALIV